MYSEQNVTIINTRSKRVLKNSLKSKTEFAYFCIVNKDNEN